MSSMPRRAALFGFFATLAAIVLLLSRCGGGDGSGSGTEFVHSFSGTYEAETGAALTGVQVVAFTLAWSETDGKITGEYKDDFYAKEPVTVEGEVAANGVRTLKIKFAAATAGVSELTVVTSEVQGELKDSLTIVSLAGIGPVGPVYTRNNIVVVATGKSPGSPAPAPGTAPAPAPGPAPAGEAGAFFAAVKGDYDFFANATARFGNGTTWTHQKKYKVTITEAGKVTIATDGTPVEFTYGAGPGDKFEKYDHEEYAIIVANGAKVLVQKQFNPAKFFVTHQPDPVKPDSAFWLFQTEDPGALKTALDDAQLGYVIGTHTATVKNVSGEGANEYPVGTAVTVTVDVDGHVKGTFGEFKFDLQNTTTGTGTKNGLPTGNIKWRRPYNMFPQWSLELDFLDKKVNRITAVYEEQQFGNNGRKLYNAMP